MFTGIITDVGCVRNIEQQGDTRIEIATNFDMKDVAIGASIACDGVCLTVIEKGADATSAWFATEASAETLDKTTVSDWRAGTLINLERALKAGDELGGHIVSGHVDGIGKITSIEPEGDSLRYLFEPPSNLMRLIATKGSVAINGVSLTVNEIEDKTFGVNIISHTQGETTFGKAKVNDLVNLEIDMLARYVARLLEKE